MCKKRCKKHNKTGKFCDFQIFQRNSPVELVGRLVGQGVVADIGALLVAFEVLLDVAIPVDAAILAVSYEKNYLKLNRNLPKKGGNCLKDILVFLLLAQKFLLLKALVMTSLSMTRQTGGCLRLTKLK